MKRTLLKKIQVLEEKAQRVIHPGFGVLLAHCTKQAPDNRGRLAEHHSILVGKVPYSHILFHQLLRDVLGITGSRPNGIVNDLCRSGGWRCSVHNA